RRRVRRNLGVAALILALMDAPGQRFAADLRGGCGHHRTGGRRSAEGAVEAGGAAERGRRLCPEGSFRLDVNADHFLYESTTKRKIENNTQKK
ncbi:MAG: hypothetical protein ACLUN5_16020, partial [Oscillospiraceae bacterium]